LGCQSAGFAIAVVPCVVKRQAEELTAIVILYFAVVFASAAGTGAACRADMP
jgi:hypothetical protein